MSWKQLAKYFTFLIRQNSALTRESFEEICLKNSRFLYDVINYGFGCIKTLSAQEDSFILDLQFLMLHI